MTRALKMPPAQARVVRSKPIIAREDILRLVLPPAALALLEDGLPLPYVRDLHGLNTKDAMGALLLAALSDDTRTEAQVRVFLNHVRRCMWQESENLATLLGYQHSNSGMEKMGRHDVARALGSVILVEPGGRALPRAAWEAKLAAEGTKPYRWTTSSPTPIYADLMALIDFVAKWLAGDEMASEVQTALIERASRAAYNLLGAVKVDTTDA